MEKRKKEYFDHALDRAISRTRRILDDLKFIREMNREGKKDVVYNFTLPTAEEECTEVYLVPISDFGKWLLQETPYLVVSPKGGKLYETIAHAQKAQNEEDSKELVSTQ